MTDLEIVVKWETKAQEFHQLGALVNGAALCRAILHDFASAQATEADRVASLAVAASESGYSVEHLGRMVRQGRILNAGRPGAPRIRVGDLPRKPTRKLPQGPRSDDLPGASTRQIVRAVVTSKRGER
jgi:hypothetical protein